jgi:hypothetical protein
VIPDYVSKQISEALPACKTEADICVVFEKVSVKSKSNPIIVLAEAINNLARSGVNA